mmetsp:Transcript_62039/g.146951  ORF Transcript_62039/g.146951 Transcript_62039/m.146951 type:complete len:261 (+) Transcript_62039:2422-3204(+)
MARGRRRVRSGLALGGHGGGGLGGGFGVAEVIALDRLEVGVELVDQRDAVGDVDPDDGVVGDAVEVLDQGPDAVAVGRDQHALAALDGWGNGLVPERQHAGDRVLQAFGQRDVGGVQAAVAAVAAFAARVGRLQGRRRGVVAAAPDQHLLVAVLLGHVGLVQALQRAVVAFVQAPGVAHRQPGAVHLVQAVPQRPDRALEHRGVGDVEVVAGFLQQPAGLLGLLDAGGRQVDVGPAGEAVFQVPGRFAVADQDELVHGRS